MENKNALSLWDIPLELATDRTTGYLLTYTSDKKIKLQVNSALAITPTISSGIIAPASTPAKIGDIYVDTVAKKLYFATGITNSSDWTIAN